MTNEHLDVLIVGAGLSGIGAAYYLQTRCPSKRYTILESRDTIGGTWDLFRYPGVRSDSDMYTLGYSFRPWREGKAIADGPSILKYIRETAHEFGIDQHIRYGHRVQHAAWLSADSQWTVEVIQTPANDRTQTQSITFTCNFLLVCSGYYDYDSGYTPEWPGVEQFGGLIVHPQKWPNDFDYTGKRVVIIGSGATAVTLVPAMAEKAAHVTMLQRSPTYILAQPTQDATTTWLNKYLPVRSAYFFSRWKAILMSMSFYLLSRRYPAAIKQTIVKGIRQQLGPDYDVDRNFAPHYNPWDQRLCLAPDGDLFTAIKSGKASVITDQIETFTERGLRLCSGQEIEADVIVTATGLQMKLLSVIQLELDGVFADSTNAMAYKGMMFSDLPNFAVVFGYTNASWTLKCELVCQYVCRLVNYMDRHGYSQCVPRQRDPTVKQEPLFNFTSGYVQRASAALPHQGSKRPWKLYQNYILDLLTLRYGALNDGTMEFTGNKGN
jgi:cation diffusion facilitator CzcD-associated flavoprotein CzcO